MRSRDQKKLAQQRCAEQLTRSIRGPFVFLFGMSGIINVLALTGSFYMLQVYDRALPSGSLPTLVGLSILAVGLYLAQGLFDVLRSQILVRLGAQFDRRVAPLAQRVGIDMPRFGFSTAEAMERGRDVDTVRGFLGSPGLVALFDLPWVPVFLVFVYMLHPYLGALTVAGAVVLALLTILAELLTRRWTGATQQAVVARNAIADSNARSADVLKAMGFADRAVDRYRRANDEHLDLQTRTTDISGTFGAIARVLRMILQSAVLGLGAYLVIGGELSAGAIIAASITSARAMAPIDQAIGNWKVILAARTAFRRLKETVIALAAVEPPMPLPPARRSLRVGQITVAAPGTGRVLLSDVGFELKAGEALGVIGPSGGGKTTLGRALTGIWPLLRGSVRLDEADLPQWDEASLGRMIGYLPQEVCLLDATVEENISRLAEDADPALVVAAAQAAGVHEMILRMPDGYKTELGPLGTALSGGQRQRIALARALYGSPFLVVLDEPNSNLDAEGEAALAAAIHGVRARGGVAIVIAHRPSVLAAVDVVAVIQDGKLTAFGPKEAILGKVARDGAPRPERTQAVNASNRERSVPERVPA
ncbi:type I secretion system permease/ATPase [Methylorubrum rhodesianum]|jgi:ATP-binding cassette subfamily C protein|uniref:type I secretion system permease/ATPase n=1 Tax=Methylorubrum TaxID=2282523 RepID=UPI001614AF62|nr:MULTISPECIES: type I secretion system permease/ATPase [Methylorubrum]MBB5760659.1 ATP-binding cassette subfamily C protein [Methylorubrum rhodesianum]MBI1689394.1 type I secretion system permease/ATPase [Methylorubrum sp. DB1722]